MRLFAVSAPGLEAFTAQELRALDLIPAPPKPDKSEPGGQAFTGDLRAVYRANLHLRTASRVLVRLDDFRVSEFWELEKKAARLDWKKFLSPGQPVAIRVTCHKSKLYHSDAIAQRLSRIIGASLGRPAPLVKTAEDNPTAQLIVVRLDHDQCLVSLDSSGAHLHQRGYRLATAKAPLRETLAAGLLFAAGWDPAAPLLDPFCGSGTIAIEAALLARGLPPGRARRFAFQTWPNFDAALWQAVAAAAAPAPAVAPVILASDRDAGAITAAQANAARAGVAADIVFTRQAVSAIQPPPGPGWVITNPPYGKRVSENKDLRNLYAQFGQVLRTHCPGWRLALLCAEAQWLTQTGLQFTNFWPLVNGGLQVKLAQTTIPLPAAS